MAEPAYSFTLSSIEDDTQRECRLYHPKSLHSALSETSSPVRLKGAIVAHPYAPLGGCYDDHVVLSVTETLTDEGFIVATFNFRGAGDSTGRTSWTGKAEQSDYMSIVGFLVGYLKILSAEPTAAEHLQSDQHINLVLAGYSYGSLVLAQLASVSSILQRFEKPIEGTAAFEITLRAKTLATETRHSLEVHSTPTSPRGRQLKPEDATTSPNRRSGVSPITVGGEETDPSTRRRSHDSRRSTDFIRKSMDAVHIGRKQPPKNIQKSETVPAPKEASSDQTTLPGISPHYLLISPVILPLTTSLCPPGPPSLGLSSLTPRSQPSSSSGLQFLSNPSLVLFGSNDVFTSSKRLRNWAEKQIKLSSSKFDWHEIEGAGHFWREEGAMEGLLRRVVDWVKSS